MLLLVLFTSLQRKNHQNNAFFTFHFSRGKLTCFFFDFGTQKEKLAMTFSPARARARSISCSPPSPPPPVAVIRRLTSSFSPRTVCRWGWALLSIRLFIIPLWRTSSRFHYFCIVTGRALHRPLAIAAPSENIAPALHGSWTQQSTSSVDFESKRHVVGESDKPTLIPNNNASPDTWVKQTSR